MIERIGCAIFGFLFVATFAVAEQSVEEIDFDRPEAWALKYFSSVSLMTPLGSMGDLERGAVDAGLEVDWIPRLDEDQRRVGFDGRKVEDLNKMPVFVRPRIRVGLGSRFALEMSWILPIELRGVTSNIFTLALDRKIARWDRFSLGMRVAGQIGEVEGDFTCSSEVAQIPPGDPGNEFGCEAPSEDVSTLNYASGSMHVAYDLGSGRSLNAGLYATYNDLEFEVEALTFGYHDQSHLVTNGWTYALTWGFSWDFNKKTSFGAEMFYSPLAVARPPYLTTESDGLFNLRAVIRYRLR